METSKKRRTEILNGDEVVFLGKLTNKWSNLGDYGLLKEGEAYIVHFSSPYQLSLVGIPGLFDKNLFERI